MIDRLFAFAVLLLCAGQAAADPWPVKVVIVATFEVGADTGDRPGELQLWAEREHLTERIDFPGGVHPLLTNADHSVVAMVSGMGLVNAGASVMALAVDKRFDVRKAYWLVAGIAGVDPLVGSIGDAAWADYVTNDFVKTVDLADAPKGWRYGIYSMGAKAPNMRPDGQTGFGPLDTYPQVFPLDPGLTRWAHRLTRDVALDYPRDLAADAGRWPGFPLAGRPPKVFIGTSASSNHYWHGGTSLLWVRDWVTLFTGGRSRFAMSDMEDAAIAEAMARLDRMGLVDGRRLMVLRTASNYVVARPGQTIAASLEAPYPGMGMPAFEAAYRVGSKVVHELTDHWPAYAESVPTTP